LPPITGSPLVNHEGNAMRSLEIDRVVTLANFDEAAYLAANPDVAQVVAARAGLESGRQHFELYGINEQRRARITSGLNDLRRTKMQRLLPALRLDRPHLRRGDTFDFLTAELRQDGAIADTQNVSSNPYSAALAAMIGRYPDGLVLDCGAGLRDVYYDNVVNFEIVDYDTTDVIGLGESLPFDDGVFDAVISVAVLEHVRDPFACAAEISRVLKPNGRLVCSVPFLVPLHGFPHHYYNMTPQGLRALFERALVVDDLIVPSEGLPIWALTWIVRSWAEGLDEPVRSEFLALRLQDLLQGAPGLLRRPWVTGLSADKNMELAAVTTLTAHKPSR
jgi:SAM-dependent methyltransferase